MAVQRGMGIADERADRHPGGGPGSPPSTHRGPGESDFGERRAGNPEDLQQPSSQLSVCRLNNWVRDATVTSQAWTAPPVKFHNNQASTVPEEDKSRRAWARRRPSGMFSSSQRALLAENMGSMVSPVKR